MSHSMFGLAFAASLLFQLTPSLAHDGPHAPDAHASAAPIGLHYQSPIANYQPYREPTIASWPRANDTVQQIGGWRSYAKEAREAQGTRP